MPLVQSGSKPHDLKREDFRQTSAFAGALLFAGDWESAHSVAQDIDTADGSYWHAIVHRQEPDAGNAGYWFRQVGKHPLFPALREEAAAILQRYPGAAFHLGNTWIPGEFIDFCELARQQPGSENERAAIEIQHAEWRLLFDWCSR